jgi:hypothetical protein
VLAKTYRNWVAAWAIGLIAMSSAHADALEDRMKACGWDLYESRIAEFREVRLRLPDAIKVQFESCGSNGPRYLIKTRKKIVALQDGWREGDYSTSYSFANEQPAPGYWIFKYQGYEWNGITFVNRQTGALKNTPGNSCGTPVFNSTGDRIVIRCYPDYANDASDLYYISLGSAILIKKLQRNLPEGELVVNWKNANTVAVRFSSQGGSTQLRTYRTP